MPLLLVALVCSAPAVIDAPAQEALEQAALAWAHVKTLTYRFEKTERLRDGTVTNASYDVKLRAPFTVYVRSRTPREGQEIIYNPERDPKHVIAHPGRFPDITLRLDVFGSMTTRGEHHIATHMGFGYPVQELRRALTSARENPSGERFIYLGKSELRGRTVENLRIEAGTKPPRPTRAQDGERLFDFAKRVQMDPYYILYTNPRIEALTDRLEGRDYLVPAYYGARIEVAIDAEQHLPIRQSIWDSAGELYERYDYFDVVVNPPLGDADFDEDNPAYNF